MLLSYLLRTQGQPSKYQKQSCYQTGTWDRGGVLNATRMSKCPWGPQFPLRETSSSWLTLRLVGVSRRCFPPAPLLPPKTSTRRPHRCLRAGWSRQCSRSLGARSSIRPSARAEPGLAYSLLPVGHASFTQFLSRRCLGSVTAESLRKPYTDSVGCCLTDNGRVRESCLPMTLDYYRWCCLNTKC